MIYSTTNKKLTLIIIGKENFIPVLEFQFSQIKDKDSETAILKTHGAEMDSGKELGPKREYEE